MSHPYASFCDEFHCNMRLGSHMPLPNQRESVLHFFEQLQKAYPTLTRFRKGEGPEYGLEEDRTGDAYRWISLEPSRLSSGQVNPSDVESAIKLHELVLELAPYELGISPIELDHLDVLFGFDLEYRGNHDEVIAESLFAGSHLAHLLEIDGARAIDYQPTLTIALSDDLRLQARVDIVTRTNTFQVRTGEYSDESISIYLIMRRFWGDRPKIKYADMMRELFSRTEKLASELVLPKIVRPVADVIASRS